MLPRWSLVWGLLLDAWASKGIEGASTRHRQGIKMLTGVGALARCLGIEGHRGGIEGASTFGFAAVLASRKASRRIGRERKSVREKAQGWICCVKFAFGQSPFVVHQPVPV